MLGPSNHARNRSGRARGGFTLIELIVVIAITGVLVSLLLVAGFAVVRGSKGNATRDVLLLLDTTAGSYASQNDANPSAVAEHPEDRAAYERGDLDQDEVRLVPVADARWEERGIILNSVGWFLTQAADKGLESTIGGLDTRFVGVYSPEPEASAPPAFAHPGLTTVFDSWGRPVRYVHPKLDGQIVDGDRAAGDPGDYADVARDDAGYFFGRESSLWLSGIVGEMPIRRNRITEPEFAAVPQEERDSDGGTCPTDRPYFYSAGADGDPATVEDNIYTTEPKFVEQGS